jgi:hypothetical protein
MATIANARTNKMVAQSLLSIILGVVHSAAKLLIFISIFYYNFIMDQMP